MKGKHLLAAVLLSLGAVALAAIMVREDKSESQETQLPISREFLGA